MNLTNISWLKVSMPRCARAPARMQVGTTAAGMTARPRLNTGTKVLLKLPQQITRPRARPMPRTGELSVLLLRSTRPHRLPRRGVPLDAGRLTARHGTQRRFQPPRGIRRQRRRHGSKAHDQPRHPRRPEVVGAERRHREPA